MPDHDEVTFPGMLVDRRWFRPIRYASSTEKEQRGMEGTTFDRLTRMAFGGSRRDLPRILVATVVATHMTSGWVAMAHSRRDGTSGWNQWLEPISSLFRGGPPVCSSQERRDRRDVRLGVTPMRIVPGPRNDLHLGSR